MLVSTHVFGIGAGRILGCLASEEVPFEPLLGPQDFMNLLHTPLA